MVWKLKEWICSGFQAVRFDGEKIFVYRNLAWSPADRGRSADSYEFRWHGISAGRLSSESAWHRDLKLVFTLETGAPVNEQDLLDISLQLARIACGPDGAFGKR